MTEEQIENLDLCWDYDKGFFGQLKQGNFDRKFYDNLMNILKDVSFEEDESIPKRVVSMLWYIPLFMEWNEERVIGKITPEEYKRHKTSIENELERILGIP